MADKAKSQKDTVTYKIAIPEQQYQVIKDRAEAQHLTMKEYGLLRLLDDTVGTEELRREIIKMMPHYYNCVNGVENAKLRRKLTEMGEKLCQL